MNEAIEKARAMLGSYSKAMAATGRLIDEEFDRAVDLIAGLDSIFIVTGLGKSGLIAQKAAATFSSTGTQTAFVHPVEALHGDLGIVRPRSAMLAISKGGGNEETIEFARQFKSATEGSLITLTEPQSRLGSLADIALAIPKLPEIDDFDLVPTTSAATSMALCDVLAICVQQKKGLTAADFAQFHPSGTLGKRLLLHVRDLMTKGDALPIVSVSAPFADLVYEISSKGLGMAILVDGEAQHFGVITDADIRRLFLRKEQVHELNAKRCHELSRREASEAPVIRGWATPDTKAIDCLTQMQESRITSLVILEDKRPIGVVRLQDLVAAGI